MPIIKKVVAMSGEEYQKLKEKAQAYDILIKEEIKNSTDAPETTDEPTIKNP